MGIGGLGAQGVVDSLERLLKKEKFSEAHQAKVLLELSKAYENSNPQLAFEKAETALLLVGKYEDVDLYLEALNTLGALAIKLDEIKAAAEYYDEAYSIAVRMDAPVLRKVDAINGKATVASYTGNYDLALEQYTYGITICDSFDLLEKKAKLMTNKSISFQGQGKVEEALTLQKEALLLEEQLGSSPIRLGKSLLSIANTYGRSRQNDSASVYVNRALSIFRDGGDHYGVAVSFSTKGNIARNQGELQEAVTCFDSARTYYRMIGNEQDVAISGMQAGEVMNLMRLSEKAVKYLREALAILEKGQNKQALLFAYQSYAGALSGMIDGKDDHAARAIRDTVIQLFLKASDLANELGNPYSEGLVLSNLGLNYHLIGACDKAIPVLLRGIELRSDEGLYNPYLTLGKCYIEEGAFQLAKQALLTSDSLVGNITGATNTAEFYQELAIAYEKLGMYAESNEALFQYIEIRNEYYDEGKAAAIADIEERYQTEKKELQNQALQLENELQAKANRNQRLGLGGLSLGLAALAGLSLFLYRQRQRIQAQKAEIELLNREQRHRMMNNLVFANSLMGLQVKRLEEQPEARQAVKEAEARLRAMSALHRRLHHEGEGQKCIDLHGYLKEITAALQGSFSTTGQPLAIELHGPEGTRVDGEAAMRIGLIVNELATNSCKHAFAEQPQPQIDVHLMPEGEGRYRLIYTDNGSGLPADFEIDTQKSMGLYLIHNLVKQLNGRIAFSGESGTRVECELNLETV